MKYNFYSKFIVITTINKTTKAIKEYDKKRLEFNSYWRQKNLK